MDIINHRDYLFNLGFKNEANILMAQKARETMQIKRGCWCGRLGV